jgi:hypothetical protein
VRRGLVGDQVRQGLAPQEFRKDVCRVAEQPDRYRRLRPRRRLQLPDRRVDALGLAIEIARAQAHVDARLAAFDRDHRQPRHLRRERLRAAHASQARGEDPFAFGLPPVMLPDSFGKGLVGALDDALRADVDPRARGHLAEHHEALAVELVEVVPRGPPGHEVGIRDQHARRVGVGLEDGHGLPGLHQQRLVVAEGAQRREDRVEAFPVARRLADPAVDHQLRGVLRDLGIEVVLDHPVGRFGKPAAAFQVRAARRADHATDITMRHGR